MKRYIVRGGYTVYETYATTIEADNKVEAIDKARKLPLENWDELQQTGGNDFEIDDVWVDGWKQ